MLLRPTNTRGTPPPEISPASVGIQGIYNPGFANPILGVTNSGGFSFGGQGGNVPGVGRFGQGFQESVNVCQFCIGYHLAGVGRHLARRLPDVLDEGGKRYRIGANLRSGEPGTLTGASVTFIAAETCIDALSVLRISRAGR